MKNKFLVLVGPGLMLGACQASRPPYPTGIYRTAADFKQQRPALAGTNAGQVFLARKVFVTNASGSADRRTKVLRDSTWGYAGADHQAYRLTEHGAYRVEQSDTLMMYSRQEGSGRQQRIAYYFSAGPSSPVHPLNNKWLKRTYPNNAAFLQSLNHAKWYQSLATHVQQPPALKSFRLVSLYRQSLGLPTSYPK
jgi:hypothetical protein